MARARKRGSTRKRTASASEPATAASSSDPGELAAAAAADQGAASVGSSAPPSAEDVERALGELAASAGLGGESFGGGEPGAAGSGEPNLDDLAGELDEEDIREMLGMFAWAFFRLLPPGIGGGEISEQESRFLGKLYSKALWPYLQSKMAPLTVALVVTGEMLLKRAIVHRAAKAALGGSAKGKDDAAR